jgi:hypothetical protein
MYNEACMCVADHPREVAPLATDSSLSTPSLGIEIL